MDLLDELSTRVLCGDGAMGTTLMEVADVPFDRCLEEFCLSAPDLVAKIHGQYIEAGARVIETNSFGANAARLERHGLENQVRELNTAAARLARQAARGKDGVFVAGSVGPLGITADAAREQNIDRRAVFAEQIGALIDGGVDLIFFETFLDLDELLLALEVKEGLHALPALCSVACAEEGRLSSGLPVTEAFAQLRAAGAKIVGVNCLNGPHATLKLLEHVTVTPDLLLSAYPNAGYPRYYEGRFSVSHRAGLFRRGRAGLGQAGRAARRRLLRHRAGADRGDVRRHPRPRAGDEQESRSAASNRNRCPFPTPAVAERSPTQAEGEEVSILDRIAAGKTVVITELDPPKTLDLEKFLAGAKALTDAGSDAITLADNSLAILRVSNLAMGAMLKQRHGIMPLLHLSCRDRNLLGLQSELMGLSALGIRHVLPLTGDPAKVGDHPGAKSVYDVTSVQLIGIIKRFNEGFNHTGKSVKVQTRFVTGCTFNPNAKFLDAQIARLERKLAAGAQYVMTQPVFDTGLVETVAKRTAHLNVPIFMGVWPLLNGRQAEFLHNEVPGILIPDHVREKMAGREGTEGRAMGIEVAKEVCRAALANFPGVYLITPFLNYELTAELASFARA